MSKDLRRPLALDHTTPPERLHEEGKSTYIGHRSDQYRSLYVTYTASRFDLYWSTHRPILVAALPYIPPLYLALYRSTSAPPHTTP